MTTTQPLVFNGTPNLTPEKADLFNTWYVDILSNYDRLSDPVAKAYHAGAANIMSDTLKTLHNSPKTEAVVEVVKSNKWSFKKKLIIIVVVVVVIDGRLPKKIKSIFDKKSLNESTEKN